MKIRAPFTLPMVMAALSSLGLSANALAQDPTTTTSATSNTTVTTTLPGQTVPAQTTVTVQPTPIVTQRVAGQHLVEIDLAVAHGSVQAYFGRAPRGEKVQIGHAELSFKLPTTTTVTKLASRDDDSDGSHKVTPDHPWHVSVPFEGSGRYVFNISDWSNDPVVTTAVVKVDGVVMFGGHGSEDDLNGWAQHAYGAGVQKTGSREIAFVIPSE